MSSPQLLAMLAAADCVRLRQKMKGHGTKFGRKKEAAVVALLTQAARNRTELVEIGPKTVKTPAVSQPNFRQ